MTNRNVSWLLFEDDLAVGTTISIGMQRAINSIKEYCEEWELRINISKTKIDSSIQERGQIKQI
jgi:hypothetical protein